jgi:hypothetical protein
MESALVYSECQTMLLWSRVSKCLDKVLPGSAVKCQLAVWLIGIGGYAIWVKMLGGRIVVDAAMMAVIGVALFVALNPSRK